MEDPMISSSMESMSINDKPNSVAFVGSEQSGKTIAMGRIAHSLGTMDDAEFKKISEVASKLVNCT